MRLQWLSLLLAFSSHALAGTLIESRDAAGGVQRVLIEAPLAKVETGEPGSFLWLNLHEGKAFAVSTEEKQMLDLSAMLSGGHDRPAANRDGPALIKAGVGPDIAGFPTARYRLMNGDRLCYEEFLSPEALMQTKITDLLRALAKLSQEDLPHEQAMQEENTCHAVERLAERQYGTLGLPLRTITADGSVIHEVVTLRRDHVFPAGTFALPSGYEVLDPKQLLERAMEQMRDVPGNSDSEPGSGAGTPPHPPAH